MQLWFGDVAGGADARDRLAARDLVAALDQDLIAMPIGRDPAVRMFDENEVAVAAQLIAGIGDNTPIGRLYCSTTRGGYIDAVVVCPISSRPVGSQDVPTNRPEKSPAVGRGSPRRRGRRWRLCGRAPAVTAAGLTSGRSGSAATVGVDAAGGTGVRSSGTAVGLVDTATSSRFWRRRSRAWRRRKGDRGLAGLRDDQRAARPRCGKAASGDWPPR